jgi:Bacteriophage clamp loader A subunit
MNPFEFVKSINEKTGNLLENNQDLEKSYTPFLVNRGLSFMADTVLAANEMNSAPFLDKRMQYDYLYASVRKRKRYAKWIKAEQDDLEDMIVEYYGVSRRKAAEYATMLTPEDVQFIKEKLNKGGTKKS